MASYNPDDITRDIKHYERLVTDRATTEIAWQAMANLMRPIRVAVRTRLAPGQQKTQYVFDGTALKAIDDLASALAGSMTSVDYQWFNLQMRFAPLNEIWEVKTWLEQCSSQIFLAFQQSNFGSEMVELYKDLAVFGTGCLWMDERPITTSRFAGFYFKCSAPGRYVMEEDFEGKPTIGMREVSVSLRSLISKFGEKALSDVSRRKYEEKPDEKIKLLHIIRPTSDENPRKKYESIYHELDTKHFLGRQYLRKMRCLLPRWDKASEEVYGTGQGHVAYPDVATLNRAVELRLRQWAKAVDPPVLTVDDGVIGKLRLMASTRTVVRNTDAVKPFDTGAKFDVANFSEAQLQVAIRNCFYADQLQLPTKSYMTAYEISSHIELMQRLLGPKIGRLKDELFNPLIDYAFDSLAERGILPPPPPVILQAAQAGYTDIDVVYTSPLTRTQRANELGALQTTLSGTQVLLAGNPALLDNIDDDIVLRDSATSTGMPARWLRDPKVRDKMREDRAQQQAEMQQAAMQNQQSQTSKNLASAATDVASLPADQQNAETPMAGAGAR